MLRCSGVGSKLQVGGGGGLDLSKIKNLEKQRKKVLCMVMDTP